MDSIKTLLGGIGLILAGIFGTQIDVPLVWWIGFTFGIFGSLLVIVGIFVPLEHKGNPK